MTNRWGFRLEGSKAEKMMNPPSPGVRCEALCGSRDCEETGPKIKKKKKWRRHIHTHIHITYIRLFTHPLQVTGHRTALDAVPLWSRRICR